MLILYFFENNTGTRAVLLVSLLVPLLSIGCARMAARRMTVSLQAPEKVHTGDRIRCTAALRAAGWQIGCSVFCVLAGRNGLTGEVFEREIPVPYTGVSEPEIESRRCGCILLTVVRAEARDWFGLMRFVRDIREEASVMVVPELYPVLVRTDPDAGTGSRETGGDHRQTDDPEPGDLRAYVPGDAVRRIHWKLSEKINRTMIRESAPEASDPAVLLLETSFPDRIDAEAMHALAQGLLSVSRAMAEEGIAHAVVTAGDGGTVVTEVTGEGDFRQAEEQVLIAVSNAGGISIGTLFRQQDPGSGCGRAILFSPHPGTDLSLSAERRSVTLVLPPSIPYTEAGAEIRVTSLNPTDAYIDI